MKIKHLLLFLILLIFIIPSFSFNVIAQRPNVIVAEITDTIDQGSVEIIKESIQKAKTEKSEAIILLLDTPGGGLSETFEIADLLHNSSIPVIGYVSPKGAKAASAGTFILMCTHIAAMTDYTIIGSCQPIEISIEGAKLINDSKRINFLVAWIQTRAEMYNRNKTIAGQFITRNLNLNATDAKQLGIIEYVSNSVDQLLKDIDGIQVNISGVITTLNTKNAKQIKYSPSIKIQIIKFISNPVLTSLLLMLGIFALIFGISSPGYGAEVFGVIAILLSLIGSGFNISEISIIFIIIGCVLLLIEIFATPGFGVIGIGGIICLVIGSIFLIPNYSTSREWMISMDWINDLIIIIIAAAILVAIFFGFLLYKVLQIRTKKSAIGTFIGEKAKTIDRLTPDKTGYIRFKGELWQAKSETTIEPNTKIIIIGKDETTLIVKQKEK